MAVGIPMFVLLRPGTTSAEREARSVAERFTQNLITFDHRTFDDDMDRIRKDVTASYQDELDAAFGGDIEAFRQALWDARAGSSGSVLGSILRSFDAGTADILVIADQRIDEEDISAPRTMPRRIELMLVETSEGWKIDQIDASDGSAGDP